MGLTAGGSGITQRQQPGRLSVHQPHRVEIVLAPPQPPVQARGDGATEMGALQPADLLAGRDGCSDRERCGDRLVGRAQVAVGGTFTVTAYQGASMKAAIYVRISSDRLADPKSPGQKAGLGVQRQERACREKAAEMGWDVVQVFSDNDVSATGRKPRPAYQHLLTAIRAGEIGAVVVWDLSRLHRRQIELEEFMRVADERSVALASVTGNEDLATKDGRMMARMKGAVAAYEVEHLKERVLAKHQQLRDAGRPTGGKRSFGFGPGWEQVVPDEAEIVRELARRVLDGESFGALARDLTERKVPTVRGAAWHRTTVRDLLRRPCLVGDLVHRGEVVGTLRDKAGQPVGPILDRLTFDRLHAVLTDPSRRRPTHTNSRVHLLSGLAECSECGSGLQVHHKQDRNGGTLLGYRCPRLHLRVSMRHLDPVVLTRAWVEFLLDVIDQGLRDKADEKRVQELAWLDQREREVAESFVLDPDVTPAQVKAMTRTLHARRREVQSVLDQSWRLGAAEQALMPYVPKTIEVPPGVQLPALPTHLGRSLVEAKIARVIVAPTSKRGKVLDPDRIKIEIR